MIQVISKATTKALLGYLCRHFGLSSSGYYAWLGRSNRVQFTRKKFIYTAIQKSFDDSKRTYGSPRIYDDLEEQGIAVSENTIAKYMQKMGLDDRHKKTVPGHGYRFQP